MGSIRSECIFHLRHRLSLTDLTTQLLDHDFVANISKKVTESRKQVLDGVGKGVVKVCKNHA